MVDLGDARFVDKRMEEAVLESSKGYADFVVKADETLTGLLEKSPFRSGNRYGTYSHPSEVAELDRMIANARNLAWALRRFPIFDLSCLKMMRKEKGLKVTLRDNWSSRIDNLELDIWVPVFAMHALSGHGDIVETWSPLNSLYGSYPIDQAVQDENRKELQEKNKQNMTVNLSTKAPPVPGAILKNADRLAGRFENISIIWEAQWSAFARVEDPLIVGKIGEVTFLLDQFDATKLERYVVGEFCKKPAE